MKKKTTDLSAVTKVKQIIESDNVAAANKLLEGGGWILLNSYHNKKFGNKPVCRLGRIGDFPEWPEYMVL